MWVILTISCGLGKRYLLRIFSKQARPWEHACSWGPSWPSSSGAASRTLAGGGCRLWRAWFDFPSWPSAALVLSYWGMTGLITSLEIQLLWRAQVHHSCKESYSSHPSQTLVWKWQVCWKTHSRILTEPVPPAGRALPIFATTAWQTSDWNHWL